MKCTITAKKLKTQLFDHESAKMDYIYSTITIMESNKITFKQEILFTFQIRMQFLKKGISSH